MATFSLGYQERNGLIRYFGKKFSITFESPNNDEERKSNHSQHNNSMSNISEIPAISEPNERDYGDQFKQPTASETQNSGKGIISTNTTQPTPKPTQTQPPPQIDQDTLYRQQLNDEKDERVLDCYDVLAGLLTKGFRDY